MKNNTAYKLVNAIILFSLIISLEFIASAQQPEGTTEIAINEKLGEYLPLDLSFTDETGKHVTLKKLIKRPTIITLVYFHCADICNPLLSSLVNVLDRLELDPGKDYSVLTISFNENDTPTLASQRKNDFFSAFRKRKFPEKEWSFLTGNIDNIKKLTDSVGFKFKKDGAGFLHPVSPLIVSSSDGRIIRYLYGMSFLPFDLKMAITEASEGRVGASIKKVLLLCYSYDSKGKKYALNILKISGIVMMLLIITFFIYLTVKGKKHT